MDDIRPPAAGAIDPDVDLHTPGQRDELRHAPVRLLTLIAVGGALGTCARYGASLLWPTPPAAFPWTTLAVNATGCAGIGLLMVLVVERGSAHPLVRPFLGTGVLGGFTTFSTYAVDIERLLDAGRRGLALGYLALTVVAALVSVWAAAAATRWITSRRDRIRTSRDGGATDPARSRGRAGRQARRAVRR